MFGNFSLRKYKTLDFIWQPDFQISFPFYSLDDNFLAV